MTSDSPALSGTFGADPIHSSLAFSVPALGVSTFRSGFERISATLEADGDAPRLTAAVELASLALREPPQFRGHLLGSEFLAAEQFPSATFASDTVDLRDDGSITVRGRLAFRGHSAEVAAHGTWSRPISDAAGRRRTHLSLEATIQRRAFGITFQQPLPNGEDGLGDDVTVHAELALVAEG